MVLLIQSRLGLDALARMMRESLCLPNENINKNKAFRQQASYGDNRGGEYYLFEILGVEIVLMQNARDALIEECSDWPFYVEVRPYQGWNESIVHAFLLQIEATIAKNCLATRVFAT